MALKTTSDAAVVLGLRLQEDGSPAAELLQRVDSAISLLRQGRVGHLIMSGRCSWTDDNQLSRTEAGVMADYANGQGVPRRVIHREEKSQDTVGNAYFTKKEILEPRAWKNIILVTSDWHMQRAAYVFGRILGPDYIINRQAVTTGIERRRDEQRVMKVMHRWLDHIQNDEQLEQVLFTKHPAYARQDLTDNEIQAWLA